jgi:SAM-dependent methyltransferase
MMAYGKLCTQFYDIDKSQVPADAMAFYLAQAREANGPVLEPMCGSGRFLVPLLEAGIDVDGTDASPSMLVACRERCRLRNVKPRTLIEQYLHELDVPRRYAMVMIPAGSFALITDVAQAREALRRIHDVLLPGGRLVLEMGRKREVKSSSWPWGGRWVDRPDGARIIISWLGHYDAATHISHSTMRYELIQDGRLMETEFEIFDLRQYDQAEFSGLLEASGFRSVQLFKADAPTAPGEADDDVVFCCVRS